MDAKYIHENIFIMILTNFERPERTFLPARVIYDLNVSILGL